MIITPQGRALGGVLIRGFEGFEAAPYLDIAGKWTIGYGDTTLFDGSPVTGSTPAISQATAVQLSDHTIGGFVPELEAMVTVALSDREAAALLSFIYNEGASALRGSTLLRDLNAGRHEAAADQFLAWTYARVRGRLQTVEDLQRRRAIERGVFLGNAPPAAAPASDQSDSTAALNSQELQQLQST